MGNSVVLRVEDLGTYFFTEGKIKKAVDGLSFSIEKGMVMGLVGVSGTGKSVVAMSILNLISKPSRC
jgi:ABC-type dipeptide/oligopeptide/nickel transport system ATPase component